MYIHTATLAMNSHGVTPLPLAKTHSVISYPKFFADYPLHLCLRRPVLRNRVIKLRCLNLLRPGEAGRHARAWMRWFDLLPGDSKYDGVVEDAPTPPKISFLLRQICYFALSSSMSSKVTLERESVQTKRNLPEESTELPW